MPFPLVVPHSDGAGVIDALGDGVDPQRMGQRVWVYGAQSYRPLGTAAQYTVVPDHQAVPLPDHLSDELGASLGIPGITAHRAVFADGPVDGQLVLVHGVLGGVGSLAAQLAHWAGATVIATVRRTADLDHVDPAVAHAIALDTSEPAAAIRSYAPRGVDRIIEVALSDNADLDNAVAANNAVIAAYATRSDRTEIPLWPLLVNNVTLPPVPPRDPLLACAVHQRPPAAAGQRRLPRRGQAPGRPRPHLRRGRRRPHRRRRRPSPAGRHRQGPRPRRRRRWPRPHAAHHPPIAQTRNTALLNCPALRVGPSRCQVIGPVPAGEGGPAFGCLGVDAEQVGDDHGRQVYQGVHHGGVPCSAGGKTVVSQVSARPRGLRGRPGL